MSFGQGLEESGRPTYVSIWGKRSQVQGPASAKALGWEVLGQGAGMAGARHEVIEPDHMFNPGLW